MNDKLDKILDLLRSINLAADILTEAISPKIKEMMVDLLKKQGWKTE